MKLSTVIKSFSSKNKLAWNRLRIKAMAKLLQDHDREVAPTASLKTNFKEFCSVGRDRDWEFVDLSSAASDRVNGRDRAEII